MVLKTPEKWDNWFTDHRKNQTPPVEWVTAADLVKAVREEFAREATAKMKDASLSLHRSKSTYDGCASAGLDQGIAIVEVLTKEVK